MSPWRLCTFELTEYGVHKKRRSYRVFLSGRAPLTPGQADRSARGGGARGRAPHVVRGRTPTSGSRRWARRPDTLRRARTPSKHQYAVSSTENAESGPNRVPLRELRAICVCARLRGRQASRRTQTQLASTLHARARQRLRVRDGKVRGSFRVRWSANMSPPFTRERLLSRQARNTRRASFCKRAAFAASARARAPRMRMATGLDKRRTLLSQRIRHTQEILVATQPTHRVRD